MLPDTFWIVVTEHDIGPNGFTRQLPAGPLVHESLCLTEDEAEERAKRLAGRFGWTTILKVDGTQVKTRQTAGPAGGIASPCQPSNQSAPMPNPAKPPNWCDGCQRSTGNLYPSDTYTRHCMECGRTKP